MTLLSVFTPSHDPTYLDDCYDSLLNQTFTDWEWVVLLNGDYSVEWLEPADDRVKVYHTSGGKTIGNLKDEAIQACSSELLVELDHDDILMHSALWDIYDAYLNHPESSLYYSDGAQINADGSPNHDRFDSRHGWDYSTDCGFDRIHALPPTPHNVSYIWYAPNHVRAFTRTTYDKVGGYNTELLVCDDQDLMCRLYQLGPFHHIHKLIYLQRVHPGNTQTLKNELIQRETVRLYNKYIEPNALAWAERNSLACLDLGGAHNSPPGYTSIDIALGAEIQADAIDYLLSLPSSSVGVIRAVDFLEHIPNPVALMSAIHHALDPNGLLLSLTPSTDGRGAFQDPTHVSFWNENSFWYYTDSSFAKYIDNYDSPFQVSSLGTYFPSPWHEENNISYVQANLLPLKPTGHRDGGIINW